MYVRATRRVHFKFFRESIICFHSKLLRFRTSGGGGGGSTTAAVRYTTTEWKKKNTTL